MRTANQDNSLPLWDQDSVVDGGAIAAGGDPTTNSNKTLWIAEEDADEGKKVMLVLIPEELEKVLRDVVRWVKTNGLLVLRVCHVAFMRCVGCKFVLGGGWGWCCAEYRLKWRGKLQSVRVSNNNK